MTAFLKADPMASDVAKVNGSDIDDAEAVNKGKQTDLDERGIAKTA